MAPKLGEYTETALPPLLPLQTNAVALLEKELAARLPVLRYSTVHEPEIIMTVAMAVPALLNWKRRELALECSTVLADNVGRFLTDQGGDASVFPYLGALLRVFRQSEIMALHKDAVLRRLCLEVMKQNKHSAAEAPFLLYWFAELARAGQILGENSWSEMAKFWAAKQGQIRRQADFMLAFLSPPALADLVSTEAGRRVGKALLDKLPDVELGASPADYGFAGVLASAATAFFQLGDGQYAGCLFSRAALVYQACLEGGEASVQPWRDWPTRASAAFLDSLSAMLEQPSNQGERLHFEVCASKKNASAANDDKCNKPLVREANIIEGAGCPLVSVVLPTYNHLKFLPESVGSLLAQDYPNLEIVIVNDGSTDGTGDFLNSLEDARIRTYNGPNSRLPAALNKGFSIAKGTMLTWTSADNICRPDFISSLVRALEKYPQAGFAYSRFDLIDEAGNAIESFSFREFSLFDAIGQNTGMASFLYRKSLAEQAGAYAPELEGAEDWDMWLRMAMLSPFVFVDKSLYRYRLHDNSMTETMTEAIQAVSMKVAADNLARIKKLGDLKVFFPQIEQCSNKCLAEFEANLLLGAQLLRSPFLYKEAPIPYLEKAFAEFPDSLPARANLAVALAGVGRLEEADELLACVPEQPQLLAARNHVDLLKKGNTDVTPLAFVPESPQSELMKLVQETRFRIDGSGLARSESS